MLYELRGRPQLFTKLFAGITRRDAIVNVKLWKCHKFNGKHQYFLEEKKMRIENDGRGNPFITVGNLRVTYVDGEKREGEKDWAGQSVIRMQAYKGNPEESQSLNMGPEYPVRNHRKVYRFFAAISYLLAEEME